MPGISFLDRLSSGEVILAGEGYIFEMQRRGHLSAGSFTPEVVLNDPEAVKQLTEEFVACGSDVVLAMTYYGNREKMSIADRADDTLSLNRKALNIAKNIALANGCLFAGNISNNPCFDPEVPSALENCRLQAAEQVELAKEAGVDFVLGETYSHTMEAMIGLKEIKKSGLPAVITMGAHPSGKTLDGKDFVDALNELKSNGADVVGVNCRMGTADPVFLELMRRIRAGVEGPIAMVPAPYRTDEKSTTFQQFELPDGTRAFQEDLDQFLNSKAEIREFGKLCQEIGIQFVGLCCGNAPVYMRALAESFGRLTASSKFSTNLQQHVSRVDNSHGVSPQYIKAVQEYTCTDKW